jgi:hypothetical protein
MKRLSVINAGKVANADEELAQEIKDTYFGGKEGIVYSAFYVDGGKGFVAIIENKSDAVKLMKELSKNKNMQVHGMSITKGRTRGKFSVWNVSRSYEDMANWSDYDLDRHISSVTVAGNSLEDQVLKALDRGDLDYDRNFDAPEGEIQYVAYTQSAEDQKVLDKLNRIRGVDVDYVGEVDDEDGFMEKWLITIEDN